jgi:hypothetical protein
MATAFQPNAFQNNAFQIDAVRRSIGKGYWRTRKKGRLLIEQIIQRRDEALAEWKRQQEALNLPTNNEPDVFVELPQDMLPSERASLKKLLAREDIEILKPADLLDDDDEAILLLAF